MPINRGFAPPRRGFTLIEVIITMGIFVVLLSLGTVSLINAQHIASLDTVTNTLITDLKQQQLKAMVGDTEGRFSRSSYGIHFDTGDYVLFHGTYNSSDPTNFTVPLVGSLSFASAGEVSFSQGSGQVTGLSVITLSDSTNGRQKVINLNSYGVVTSLH
ncbi:type II secretion system GspH family protein [Patescibacteria group bacterium]|nr:type II secretion system GspH family protein [Patescibacteria group bacterium]